MHAGFQMCQAVASSELHLEVVAVYCASLRACLWLNFSLSIHGQREWRNAEHINQGRHFDAELNAISETMKDFAGG